MKTFAVNITLPAVMFSAFATAEYSARSMMIPLVIFSLCVLSLLLGFALCRALSVPGRLSPYLSAGFEAGMLGYALFALLFPGEGSAAFAIIDLGQVLFVFTLYKALLAGRGGLGGVIAEAAHAPTVWAIIAGIAVGASGLYKALTPSGVSGVLDAVAGFVAAPTSAVILLTIGYDLVPEEIALKRTVKMVALRLIVAAAGLAVVLPVNRFLLGGMMHTGALVLMLTLPPPYVLPVFADVEDERADISSALSVLTLLSLVLFMVLTVVYA
jgi:predicted permease